MLLLLGSTSHEYADEEQGMLLLLAAIPAPVSAMNTISVNCRENKLERLSRQPRYRHELL